MEHTAQSARSLEQIVWHSGRFEPVSKSELQTGDLVLVTTRNSRYSIWVVGDETYSVSGGWFDEHGLSPLTTTINGCTWGGHAIKHDIIAACGLFLEFGNRVTTSRIQNVRIVRCRPENG